MSHLTRTVRRIPAIRRPVTTIRSFSCSNKALESTTASTNSAEPPRLRRPLTEQERALLDPIIRVDQSGEVGAYYIYAGQMAVLGRDKKLRPILQEMWDQEKKHLERFDHLVGEMRVRPSLLRPLWEVAGFAVGAGTALLGKEAAMACTEAVETVIGSHYDEQLRNLVKAMEDNPDLKELGKTIAQFRDEELEHHDIAVAHDAQRAPFHSLLKTVIMQGCKTAIWIAERV